MKKTSVIIVCLLLSACGWHLRGSLGKNGDITKHVASLYVATKDIKSDLYIELRQQIKALHIPLSGDAESAAFLLTIVRESKDKHTTGVSSNALSSAYEMTLKVDYEIRARGASVTNKASATASRSYNYDSSALNSAAQEELLLEKEMRRDLAQQMLRRLNAVATHPQAPATSEK